MSAPDFKDMDYEPSKPSGRSASDDAESCVTFCCRLPITTCAIIGGLGVVLWYLMLNQNPLLQLLGVLIVVSIVGGFYFRYGRKLTSSES
ncbi:MAG: hypothetical protein ACFFCT_12145 [Candidatus Odinarchaeota archaeon]